MITTALDEALQLLTDGDRFPADRTPTMRAALLVTPEGFDVSLESAQDNAYMSPGMAVDLDRAHAQHQNLVRTLRNFGLPVLLFPGRPGLPDGIYPNNVFATVSGRLIVGAMRHAVRRAEAERDDIRRLFVETFGYEIHDLSTQGCVAELTGPLIIDRARGIGYCGMTERVDEAGRDAMHEAFHLRATWSFPLVRSEYHTNLVLSVLAGRACVVHPGSFDGCDPTRLLKEIYGGRILELNDEEKAHFAGNCLAVPPRDVLFSETARVALRPSSLEFLDSWGFRSHFVPVDELEKGGGSLRCLIAEVF